MKANRCLRILIVCVILFSILGVNLSFAQHTESSSKLSLPAKFPWTTQYVHQVDYPEDVGNYASLAFRPFDELPYVSYYDSTNGDLMLAHLSPNGGGNCGTDNSWKCEVLDGDNGDDVGSYTSLAFWSDEATQTWKIGISYHDITNDALKFITWTCTELTCTMHKKYTIEDSTNGFISYGLHTSFKFGINGYPIIAYQRNYLLGDDSLRLANYDLEGNGNCGEAPDVGEWQCDVIDVGEGTGRYISLDQTYDGSTYIAYYDEENHALRLASFWGIIEDDCYDDNGWACQIIDNNGDVGMYASLVMQRTPTDTQYRIAYYNNDTNQVLYTDPNMDPIVVDDMGDYLGPVDISMDVDGDGYPVIAYQQIDDEFSPAELNIARPFLAYGADIGNCGDVPPGYLFFYWYCSTIDNGGQYLSEAEFISVATKSNGMPVIAYTEFYNYDIGDHATSLKLASQYFYVNLPILMKP